MVVAAQVANGGTGAWGVLRYGRKGRLDDNFGRDGIRVLSFGPDYEFARSVAVQPNGRIVVAGRIRRNADDQWGIVRLKGNGSFDKGFAKRAGDRRLRAWQRHGPGVVLQDNGKIVSLARRPPAGSDGSPWPG